MRRGHVLSLSSVMIYGLATAAKNQHYRVTWARVRSGRFASCRVALRCVPSSEEVWCHRFSFLFLYGSYVHTYVHGRTHLPLHFSTRNSSLPCSITFLSFDTYVSETGITSTVPRFPNERYPVHRIYRKPQWVSLSHVLHWVQNSTTNRDTERRESLILVVSCVMTHENWKLGECWTR